MQYGNAALQIVAAIVLARLLAPEDFGLVAIVTVLTSFAPLLIDFGLLDATAQRSRITPAQVSGLFWVSSGIGLAVAVVVAACSPLIAWLYGEPRLQPIALCTAITFVLSGLSNQHMALLRRTMQFGKIGQIQFLGTLAGIVVADRCRDFRIRLLGAGAASDHDVTLSLLSAPGLHADGGLDLRSSTMK